MRSSLAVRCRRHHRKAVLDIAGQIFGLRGQFAHDDDQVLLDFQQPFAQERRLGGGSGRTEGGVQFIDAPISFDARMTFGNAAVVHQARRAIVPLFCGNAHSG